MNSPTRQTMIVFVIERTLVEKMMSWKSLWMAFALVVAVFCSDRTSSAQELESGSQSVATQLTPEIMDSRTGEAIQLNQLLDDLARQDVIFLGEQHDNDSGHVFQLQVIQGLIERGVNVVVSTEQFERDVQGVVDDYLADRITEEKFLENGRPWKNYQEHYRPIIELARSKRIPVIAGNIPRRLASNVSKKEPVSLSDQVYLPRSTDAPKDAYWQKFMDSMKGHGGTDGNDMMLNFYASQCLKDDAMAESITDYLAVNSHQPKVVVHLCGRFHSDYGLGTAARVLQRRPLTHICVVTMELIPEDGKRDVEAARARGHYVFWTVKN